ncbi:hypothetical protein Rhein_0344 [Rheinheimera sp. A13L]|uniref:hypothetical protein n=1 Tax=Rheinheimera sp. A13L TaxID=506534 RepID=UPI0002125185|nr:hypothetical protein [Rheinheimera sp. A13L]EGM79460.1 hypothetical protein Rhein_0344 [Rheinheimera sp. A13L]
MNMIKLIVAVSILASFSFAAEKAPATEQNLNLEFANLCPQWPICRQITTHIDETVVLPNTTKAIISKTA